MDDGLQSCSLYKLSVQLPPCSHIRVSYFPPDFSQSPAGDRGALPVEEKRSQWLIVALEYKLARALVPQSFILFGPCVQYSTLRNINIYYYKSFLSPKFSIIRAIKWSIQIICIILCTLGMIILPISPGFS